MYIWYSINIYEMSNSESYLSSRLLVAVSAEGRRRVDSFLPWSSTDF